MAWYSIRTETGTKHDDVKVIPCPECDPSKTMEIEAVFPLSLWGGSIVTYLCRVCGYRDDILIE